MNKLYIMCGIPGSGKSTYAKNLNGFIVSSDAVRKELYGDEKIQGNPKEVFARVDELTREHLKIGNVIYDATSITPKIRKNIINKFPEAEPICVYVSTPFNECIERNNKRERTVSAEVMEKMMKNFVPPKLEEGFSKMIIC